MKIDRILFATDFSEQSEAALPHALWYAREFGAELHLLHALVLHDADPANPEAGFPDLGEAYEKLRGWASRKLRETSGPIDEAGVTVKRIERRGIDAAGVILDYAREEEMDLIVLSTHGRRGIRRMMLGSVAEEVVRLAARPVLTVRASAGEERETGERQTPEQGETEPGGAPDDILVPIDFSEHSDRALTYGDDLARRIGARLHALHVLPATFFPDAYFAEAAEVRAMVKGAKERVPEELHRHVREVLGEDTDITTHLEVGAPAVTIARVAGELEIGLVVIASHGRTGLERMLLGSVAEGVVRRAGCPVMTVKVFGRDLLAR